VSEKIYLVLGCFGRVDDNFVSCAGTCNKILLISEDLEHYDQIITYLDNIKMFDKPILDTNAVRNIIYKFQNDYLQNFRKIWSEKFFRLYENFLISHKACGIYLQLVLDSDNEQIEIIEENPVMARVEDPNHKETAPPPNLKVIRGRR